MKHKHFFAISKSNQITKKCINCYYAVCYAFEIYFTSFVSIFNVKLFTAWMSQKINQFYKIEPS